MTTSRLPLGPAAGGMIKQLEKWQQELEDIHGNLLAAFTVSDAHEVVKQYRKARDIDKKMELVIGDLGAIYRKAERLRKKGKCGDDIYFFPANGDVEDDPGA